MRWELDAILAEIAARRRLDFRDYRRETLERGVEARLAATCGADVVEYHARLARDPSEMDRLVESLVVPVTAFFRDTPVFDALEERVVPDLVARVSPDRLRAWAIGVATGEEAWSLGMVLGAALGDRAPLRFDVLGSDVDSRSVEIARRARYSAEALLSIPGRMRERFVRRHEDGPTIDPSLLEVTRFAEHDVVGSRLAPPAAVVASFHLVLFRNVLIYFDRRLQGKALERVVSVLRPGGVLVLGPVETVPKELAPRLAPFPGVDEQLRIFRLREERAE